MAGIALLAAAHTHGSKSIARLTVLPSRAVKLETHNLLGVRLPFCNRARRRTRADAPPPQSLRSRTLPPNSVRIAVDGSAYYSVTVTGDRFFSLIDKSGRFIDADTAASVLGGKNTSGSPDKLQFERTAVHGGVRTAGTGVQEAGVGTGGKGRERKRAEEPPVKSKKRRRKRKE